MFISRLHHGVIVIFSHIHVVELVYMLFANTIVRCSI